MRLYAAVMTVVPDRALVRMTGPDAVAHLQSMVSNDVEAIPAGGGAYALLLTPKARVIADLEVFNTGGELVLACSPEVRDDLVDVLVRARFRKKVELEPAAGAVVWGEADGALATLETPIGPYRLVEQAPSGNGAGEWEVARIEAGIPRFGHEFGPDTMPAEAGLVERAVSFTKGCYPGQEPIARLHYRGRPNRRLVVLEVDHAGPGDEIVLDGKAVGRVTSAVPGRALGYVRREVPDDAVLRIGGAEARLHLATPRP